MKIHRSPPLENKNGHKVAALQPSNSDRTQLSIQIKKNKN